MKLRHSMFRKAAGTLAVAAALACGAVQAPPKAAISNDEVKIGMLLASDAQLLLLDEPTAGMTAQETHFTGELIRQLVREHGLSACQPYEYPRAVLRRVSCDLP